MDSCVSAAIAVDRHGPENVAAFHASYGQRTQQRERRSFVEIANFYDLKRRLVADLKYFSLIGGSALTDQNISIPENKLDSGDAQGSMIPVTYVPFRNAHFLSIGTSWGEAIGAKFIYIGAVAEDSSGYPDCRPEYYAAFQGLIRVGTRPETKIEIVTPVIRIKKDEI